MKHTKRVKEKKRYAVERKRAFSVHVKFMIVFILYKYSVISNTLSVRETVHRKKIVLYLSYYVKPSTLARALIEPSKRM